MTTVAVVALCGVAGLGAGWILTMVIRRVPEGRLLLTPPYCDHCEHHLRPREVIPVVSWIVHRNRCRWCTQPIGLSPLLVEIATPSAFVLIAVCFGSDPAVPAYCVFAAALIGLTAIDLRVRRLPREITYAAIILGAPLLVVAALVDDAPGRVARAAAGAALVLAGLWIVHLVSRGDLGGGDVRLAPLLGLYLGYVSFTAVLVGLFLGFLFGAIAGVIGMIVGRGSVRVPFGPFLAAGAFLTLILLGPGGGAPLSS